MDLRHLRYFVVLAEELHFGRAALRLGISQPPLSQQIRSLETELGVTLLTRTSRRAKLTDAGRHFLVEAKKTLTQADRARDVARHAAHGEIGELNIGFTPSAPLTSRFRDSIRSFHLAHPQVHLALHELPTRQQIEKLAEGHLQIAFLRTAGTSPILANHLVGSELDREEIVAVLRNDHPLASARPNSRLSLASLVDEPFVAFPNDIGGSTYDQIATHCRAAGFEPKVAYEARGAMTLLGLVSAGLGVALMAASFRHILIDGLIVRRLAKPVPVAATWLAHSKDDVSPVTEAFLKVTASSQRKGPTRR